MIYRSENNNEEIIFRKAKIEDGSPDLNITQKMFDQYVEVDHLDDLRYFEKRVKELLNLDISFKSLGLRNADINSFDSIKKIPAIKASYQGIEFDVIPVPSLVGNLLAFGDSEKPKLLRNQIDKATTINKDNKGNINLFSRLNAMKFSCKNNSLKRIGRNKDGVGIVDYIVHILYSYGKIDTTTSKTELKVLIQNLFYSPYIRKELPFKFDRLIETYVKKSSAAVSNPAEVIIEKELKQSLIERISFDRFIGQELEDGTLITEEYLNSLPQDTTRLNIKYKPKLAGFTLAESIMLKGIKKGMSISNYVRDNILPTLEDGINRFGRYTHFTEDLLNEEIHIPKDTIITEDLEQFIYQLADNLKYITVKEGKKAAFHLHFTKEVYRVLPTEDTHLTFEDYLAILSFVSGHYDWPEKFNIYDRDLNFEKEIYGFNKLWSKYYRMGFEALLRDNSKSMKSELSHALEYPNATKLENYIRKIYKKMIELMGVNGDNVIINPNTDNPVSILSSIRALVPSHISSSPRSADQDRAVLLHHLGSIDPFDSPQGKQTGLAVNSTLYSDLTSNLDVPVRKIIKKGGNFFLSKEVIMLPRKELVRSKVTTLDSLEFSNPEKPYDLPLKHCVVTAIVPNTIAISQSQITSSNIPVTEVDYVLAYYDSPLSTAISLIPLAGGADSARITFGGAMLKQIVPASNPDKPRILTPTYSYIHKAMKLSLNASFDGKVTALTQLFIEVTSDEDSSKKERFNLYNEFTENKNIVYKVKVTAGESIKKGQTLAESLFADDGQFAPGKNLFIGFMAFKGQNFDDSLVVSQNCAENFKSIYNSIIEEKVGPDKPEFYQNEGLYKHYKANERIGRYQVGKSIKVIKTSLAKKGTLIKDYLEYDKEDEIWKYRFHLREENAIVNGDKLAGLYGNKGTVSAIAENSKMPRFKNGVMLDVLQTPTGVPSRMNTAQIQAGHLGFCMYLLNATANSTSYGGATSEEIYTLLHFLYEVANSTSFDLAASKFAGKIPDFVIERAKENYSRIKEWEGCFTKEGHAILINPTTGKEYFGQVTFGVSYYIKLIHQVEHKVNYRGALGGEYKISTNQPPKGVSKKGGQTNGEMELWLHIAYGSTQFLTESINEKSSHVDRRQYIEHAISNHKGNLIETVDEDYYEENPRYSTQMLGYFVEALGLTIENNNKPLGKTLTKLLDEAQANMMEKVEYNEEKYKSEIIEGVKDLDWETS